MIRNRIRIALITRNGPHSPELNFYSGPHTKRFYRRQSPSTLNSTGEGGGSLPPNPQNIELNATVPHADDDDDDDDG